MKAILLAFTVAATLGLGSCSKCYTCTSQLGTETDCCGDKEECEVFREDCTLTGGTLD